MKLLCVLIYLTIVLINYYNVDYYDVYKLIFIIINMFETIKSLINWYAVCLMSQRKVRKIIRFGLDVRKKNLPGGMHLIEIEV